MPVRNCETRPVSWRTHKNKAVANAIDKLGKELGNTYAGFIIWPMWIGFITHRDNLGYYDGRPSVLRDDFYPHQDWVSIQQVTLARDMLASEGLIIVYQVDGLDYILIPKVSRWSKIVGNISGKTDFPQPPEEKIKDWEVRFNEVYTPLIHRSNAVYTPYERCTNDVCTESKSKIESKREIERRQYITDFFKDPDKTWVSDLKTAYVDIDIQAELGKMRMWLLANLDKPKKNLKRFAVNWLNHTRADQKKTPIQKPGMDIEKFIDSKLGKIATKDMIKTIMKQIPENQWFLIDSYLKRRYPGGGNGFSEAERELAAEARENRNKIGALSAHIGGRV